MNRSFLTAMLLVAHLCGATSADDNSLSSSTPRSTPSITLSSTLSSAWSENQAPLRPIAPFQPISDEELLAARQQVVGRLAALDATLVALPDRGAAWREYLQWEGIESLSDPQVAIDGDALRASLNQFESGAWGLELPLFRDAATAIGKLLDLHTFAQSGNQQASYQRLVQLVEQLVKQDPEGTNPRLGPQLEKRLDLLAGVERAPELVASVKRSYGKSNLLLTVAEPVVKKLISRPIATRDPIRDTILGAQVIGVGNTRGYLSVDLVASDDGALLNFLLHGGISSRTTGFKGPVAVRSLASTRFVGHQPVKLAAEQFLVLPAQVSASTRSRTVSIHRSDGSPAPGLLQAFASKRVDRDRPQGDAIASRRAESRLNASLSKQIVAVTESARRQFDDYVIKPLARYGASPARIWLSSTDSTLQAEMLHADRGQLGAATPAPPAPAGDVVLRVHVSAVNNLGAALIGGTTLRKQAGAARPKLEVFLPTWLNKLLTEPAGAASAGSATDEQWAMILHNQRPFSARVEGGAVVVHLHAAKILSRENVYRGWDIILQYRPVRTEQGWRLERSGTIDVLPTGFNPQAGRRLKGRQIALRGNLVKSLNDSEGAASVVPATILLPPIDLSGFDRPAVGQLAIREFTLTGNWVTIVWDAF